MRTTYVLLRADALGRPEALSMAVEERAVPERTEDDALAERRFYAVCFCGKDRVRSCPRCGWRPRGRSSALVEPQRSILAEAEHARAVRAEFDRHTRREDDRRDDRKITHLLRRSLP